MNIQAIKPQDAHIWQLDLNWSADSHTTLLSDAELKKINAFIKPEHRQRALSMRIQLRLLLSCYLRQAAETICFETGRFGKPQLVNGAVSFNVSHSHSLGVVAIGDNNNIGVDIEQWRTVENREGIVRRHFSAIEKKAWNNLDDCDKEAFFFSIWTCKEAFIKATGRGLGMGLSNSSFNIASSPKLLDCPLEYGQPSGWTCVALDLAKGVSGTMMVKSRQCLMKQYIFEPNLLPQLIGSL
ncbi:MAG: 4-phosphopantetheinyl transferase [Piscirickettsiaceae bacterium]|nr:MAG: 4-phosphopantetheinyl transferase [Piscirickettsiaceae bacterium]